MGDLELELTCSYNLASTQLRTGNTAAAVRTINEVLEVCRGRSDASGEAFALYRLGDVSRSAKQHDRAAQHLQEALSIFERIGSIRECGVTHGALAAVYRDIGKNESALTHCQRALEIHSRTRDEVARCDALMTLTDVERELRMYQDAIQAGQQAVAISEEIADSQRRCRALAALADALAAAGRASTAHRMYVSALNIMDEISDPELTDLRSRILARTNLVVPFDRKTRAS
jgi:tetratricopeptide (TPR) repeat protein